MSQELAEHSYSFLPDPQGKMPPGTLQPVLEAKGISVIYGNRKVLDVPSLQVFPNQVLSIIGPNGSGKTTLLLCLSLLLRPATGDILYQGHIVPGGKSVMRMRRRFAVTFQEPLLLNTSVWDNVTMGMRIRGFSHQEIKDRAQYWLERFGIASLAQRNARTLSGGEAQRASLARAFVLQPEILFLDEPFAALDVPTRQSLFGDMINILQETKLTTVMVTHDRNEAQTLAQRVAVIMQGNIVQIGDPKEIFTSPVNEEIAKFVGMENIIEGTIISKREGIVDINVKGQTIEGLSGCDINRTVNVLIRPEDITLSLEKTSTSARNIFSGRISSLIPIGPLVRVSLDCGFPLIALITRMSADELKLIAGTAVYACFKATAIHVIGTR
jgi:tungstate transport system ATP-binding protein